jgi:hypothetical protein
MSVTEFEPFSASKAERSEHFPSSIELKELFAMFAESAADEQTVLDVIEQALLEPIPPLDDLAAVEEYNTKMEMLREMAKEYVRRSDLLKDLRTKIEEHIVRPTE